MLSIVGAAEGSGPSPVEEPEEWMAWAGVRLSLPEAGVESVNTELLQALPYLVTIAGMALFAHRVRPPAALTRPFLRGLK